MVTTFDFNATYLEIEWNTTALATGYLVELVFDADSMRVTTTSLSATFTLQPATQYRATVQAIDASESLGDSFERLFTAPALRTYMSGCMPCTAHQSPL